MLSSRWPRSPSHGKCSKRFCGSSRSYGRSHHRETFSMSCIQEQPTEGVRPNARENGQINPSTIVRAARAARSQPYLPSGFQGRCKIATLHAGFGVIRGMSVEYEDRPMTDDHYPYPPPRRGTGETLLNELRNLNREMLNLREAIHGGCGLSSEMEGLRKHLCKAVEDLAGC